MRSAEVIRCKSHTQNTVHNLAIQYCDGIKEERGPVHVHRLHSPQQGLSQRWLPLASNQLVDEAAGCERMSLLDCFSDYHQIWMKKEDEDKTSFITPFGVFCFLRMPEGLRSAGTTFNRMIKIVLGPQMRRNISDYVDDVVVHSKRKEYHIEDLRETFRKHEKIWAGAKPRKVHFWSVKGQTVGMSSIKDWHSGQSRKDRSNKKHENTKNEEGHTEANW